MRIDRTVSGRPWRLAEAPAETALAISQRHGLGELVGRVLAGRGLGLEAVPAFLEPRLRDWLPDPSHLQDLDRAAARLADALAAGERFGIIGDYDVDGATSAALVVRFARAFGVEPVVLIPDRLVDGYGASPAAFDRLALAGCRLVLCLDNGTTAFSALAHGTAAGQEIVVVDHHMAEERLPEALAVVNPNRRDQRSPVGHLAAVGVVFLLLVAVGRELRRRGHGDRLPDLLGWLDLVALGTVADVVPLQGLNRAFVRQGLRVAASAPTPGLAALATAAGLAELRDGWQLGFALGPRINAGGRLGQPDLGVRLLTTDDAAEARSIAARLDGLNRERQALEQGVLQAAEAAVRPQLEAGHAVLLAEGRGWHVGVLGIVAARLVERFHRPAFVIALEEGVGKGSGRSIPGVDLGALVIAARRAGILKEAGGHAMAAGLTIHPGSLDGFRAFLEEHAGGAGRGAAPPPELLLEGALAVGGVTVGLAGELEQVAPFGAGNQEPRFCLTDARVATVREVGTGHLSCILAGTAVGRLKAIAFRAAGQPLARALRPDSGPLRLAGRIKLDRWRGSEEPGFQIDDAAQA